MGTTPNGWPYPDGTDLVTAGDDAIQALADALDSRLTRRYLKAWDGPASTLLANTTAAVAYTNADGYGFTSTDSSVYTYTGPPAWFLLGCGAGITSSGSVSNVGNKVIQLLVNGVAQLSASQISGDASLGLTWQGALNTGDTLHVTAAMADWDGYYIDHYLWALMVPA